MNLKSLVFGLVILPFSGSPLYADQPDPCEKIAGHWKGYAKPYSGQPHCKAKIDGTFTRYNSTIRYHYHAKPNSYCSSKEEYINTLVGSCKEAYIKLEHSSITGSIFGDTIDLISKYDRGTLKRVS